MERLLDFTAGNLCQFLPEVSGFLASCFEASFADHHRKFSIGSGQKDREKAGERLPLNLEGFFPEL